MKGMKFFILAIVSSLSIGLQGYVVYNGVRSDTPMIDVLVFQDAGHFKRYLNAIKWQGDYDALKRVVQGKGQPFDLSKKFAPFSRELKSKVIRTGQGRSVTGPTFKHVFVEQGRNNRNYQGMPTVLVKQHTKPDQEKMFFAIFASDRNDMNRFEKLLYVGPHKVDADVEYISVGKIKKYS